jgi:hypothetical protein
MTEARALALRFKADWEIWSNPMPSSELQAFEAQVREYFRGPGHLALLPGHPCCSVKVATAMTEPCIHRPRHPRYRQGMDLGGDGCGLCQKPQGKGVRKPPRANVVCLPSVEAWGLENIHIDLTAAAEGPRRRAEHRTED